MIRHKPGRTNKAIPVNQLPTEIAPPVPEKLAKIDPSLEGWRNEVNSNWQNAINSLNRVERESPEAPSGS